MLTGIVSNNSDTSQLKNTFANMVSSLLYKKYKIDELFQFPYAIARIHLGAFDNSPQPHTFSVNQNKLALFFDGKILSVKGIKDEDLGTKRDAEIFERLLQEFPLDDALRRINGTFVGVIVNTNTKEIVLFNDKHGTRYLFYSVRKDSLIFSSEMKAWRNIEGFDKKIDWTAVLDLLKYGRILGEKTLACYIKKMLNASILKYDFASATLSASQYWDYNYREQRENPDKQYFIDEFSRISKAAAQRCFIRTSGTLGVNLSGGLDTRLILSAISPSSRKRAISITYGDKGCLESKIARKLAETKGLNHIFLPYAYDGIGPFIKDAAMLTDSSAPRTTAALSWAAEALRRKYGISVILTGVEGDVLYGGSIVGDISRSHFLKHQKSPKGSIAESFENWSARGGFTDEELIELFQPIADVIRNKRNDSLKFLEKRLSKVDIRHPVNKADYLFLTPHPPNIVGTGVVTRHWLEDIPLMFDDDLVELYLKTPPDYRRSDLRKSIIKKNDPSLAKVAQVHTLVSLNAPYFMTFLTQGLVNFLRRTTYLLRTFSHGRVDLRKYLAIDHIDHDALSRVYLREYVADILLDKKTVSRPFLNRTYFRKMVTDFLSFRPVSHEKISRLLALELWLRMFIDETDNVSSLRKK